ncbi:MAG: class I SAM-dependent methyltransferase [Phycisphaerae bacterium]|nr:class I SAM-dependent methyltransferase [Phycisphaerae bacterium]
MTGGSVLNSHTLFDFGPLASEYERWYATPAGKAYDEAQKSDIGRFLEPALHGARLLDVGCGTGHWSRFFASLGYRVVGIDISEEMTQVAKARWAFNCHFGVADVLDLPFDDHRFDVVTAMAVMEFTSDPAAGLQEMARCVTHGGHMLIGTLNSRSALNQQRLSEGKQPYASAHLFSPEEVHSLLAPWGEVHMVDSMPGERNTRPLLPGRLGNRLSMHRGRLRGPFIVAEVRR